VLAIIHADLILEDHLIPDGYVLVDGGRILKVGPMENQVLPTNCDILDAGGLYLGPGLVDIHTHAGNRIDFLEDPIGAAGYHLSQGTTGVMPALYFSMDQAGFLEGIRILRTAMQQPGGENILGIYMEGPYMNPKYGADRNSCPWAGPIQREAYLPILEAGGDSLRVLSLAPERPGILDFVKDAKKLCPNARLAVGHSEAEPQQIEALIPWGLCLGTHHTNATGTLVKYPEVRGVCVDEAVNYRPEIYAELISDSKGIHVDPYMQRLVRKIKGDDRLILISDATNGDGPIPPGYDGVTDINFDHEGEIDGSNLTMNVACRNFMVHTGASLCDVFRMASRNPSRVLGLTDRGTLRPGARADLILVDHQMQVKQVVFQGKLL